MRPKPHAYDCACEQCVSMAKAIAAQNPDGSYVFTDEELYRLALRHEADDDESSDRM